MNKNILVVGLLIGLTGCISMQFDSMEYDRFLSIKEMADSMKSRCADNISEDVAILQQLTNHQYLYTSYREAKPQVAAAAVELKNMVDELVVKYQNNQKPSVSYCELKLGNIALGAATIARTTGRL